MTKKWMLPLLFMALITKQVLGAEVPTGIDIDLISVNGGCFQMGDTFGDGFDDEKPVHEVCLSDFSIGKYKVTQGQWQQVMGDNPSDFGSCGLDCPVENVSWNDAQEFIRRLNQQTGKGYRLPTEAEWEYAARSAGKTEKYAGTNDGWFSRLENFAWYDKNSEDKTHPVGQKQPNGLGIYDMNGNVSEWLQDVYDSKRYGKHKDDSTISQQDTDAARVVRGGSWKLGIRLMRATFRDNHEPSFQSNQIGFRLACSKNGKTMPPPVIPGEAQSHFRKEKTLDVAVNAPKKGGKEVNAKERKLSQGKGQTMPLHGVAVDVDEQIPAGKKAGKYDVAVIIGNRNYAVSGAPDVEFADRDAQTMREYVVKTLGYDPKNIIYAEDATLSKFNEIFGTERDSSGKLYRFVKAGESRVFIYYVGHGAPDLEKSEAYIVPVDADPHYISVNGYRLQTFYDNLSKIPAKSMTVVLDSCFSGSSEKGLLFKNISPALVKVKKDLRGPANAVVITSAGLDQVSTWYPEKRHSLFTYVFLKGLQGEADSAHAGKVTVGDMQRYLKENVPYLARRLTGNEQQPVVMGNENDVIVVFKK